MDDTDKLIHDAMQAAIDWIMIVGPQVGKEQQEQLVQQLKKCVELRDEAAQSPLQDNESKPC